jgi:hypothetical protein
MKDDNIERFRRSLNSRDDLFEEVRRDPEYHYFAQIKGSRMWASAVVVDFAMGRAGSPIILILNNGFIQEFHPSKDMSIVNSEIEISEKLHHRIARWFGDKLHNQKWSHVGVYEVTTTKAVKWDFTTCDIVRNLEYAACLATRLGIKRVAVVTEPGLSFSLPATVGDGVRVKILPTVRTKQEREYAFALLRQNLASRSIRIPHGSELMSRVKAVLAIRDGNDFTPGDAHPSIIAMGALCLSLKVDENGQIYFPEDSP